MGSIPVINRRTEPLSHHETCCLSDQGHRHLPVADVQIHGACTMPPQSLVVFEKLLDVPSCGVIDREVFHFISITGAEKCFKVIILGTFAFTLNKLVIGAIMTPGHGVRLLGGSIPCPMPTKGFTG